MDFTESLFFDARGILSRKGVPEIDPWGFLYPLTGSVWAAVAAALAVVWLATTIVGRRPGRAVSISWAVKVFLQNVRVFFNQGNCSQQGRLTFFFISDNKVRKYLPTCCCEWIQLIHTNTYPSRYR